MSPDALDPFPDDPYWRQIRVVPGDSPEPRSGLTALDLFCGAGGSSTGLVGAGVNVKLAANHWSLAVEVHQENHPMSDHDCADISAVDPRRYPTTEILWASPECTNHSVARGVRRITGQVDMFDDGAPDPSAERSRATMWDVPRFVEAMLMRGRPYRAVIVENVVDVVRWMFWPAWLAAMDAAGYDGWVVYLNSAFAHGKDYGWLGAPQYRDRIYVVFWRKGATAPDLDVRPPGWCPRCEAVRDGVQTWKRPFERHWGRYRAQYVYTCAACHGELEPFALPAAAAINWGDLGGRIGDRARPLAPATRARIRAGLARYGRPLMTPAGGTWNESAMPVDVPMRARTTRETEAITCPPMVVPVEARGGLRARTADEPMRTTRLENSAVVPEAFLAVLRGRSVASTGFVMRNNNNGGDGGGMCTPSHEPVRTLTAKGHQSVVTAPDALLMPYYGTGVARPVDVPAGTVTTRDRHALVVRSAADVTDAEVDGCTFRMLEPGEILAAMAFPSTYLMRGTKRDRVRMAGNAVTPPAARLIAERVVAALAADR